MHNDVTRCDVSQMSHPQDNIDVQILYGGDKRSSQIPSIYVRVKSNRDQCPPRATPGEFDF
jgi:hypothetical protein